MNFWNRSCNKLLRFLLLLAIALASFSGPVSSQSGNDIVEAASEDTLFEFLDPENQTEAPVELRVEGHVGTLDAASFPGVLRFRSNAEGVCTATMVGPQAAWVAAHCLRSRNYSIKLQNRQISMRCFRSRTYNIGIEHSNDWAICKLEEELPRGIISVFETLDVVNRPKPGKVIMVTGYGCTVEDGPSANKLLYGYAKVVERPPGVAREDTAFWTQATVGDPNLAASLCAGDSGGPAFRTGPGGPTDKPRIVGVNSRVHYDLKVSWFSATASVTGIGFFNSFVEDLDTPVCGLKYHGQIYERNCR